MVNLSFRNDADLHISTMVVTGVVTPDELIDAAGKFYADEPSSFAICDMSQANLRLFSSADVQRMLNFTVQRAQSRSGGKTAIIASGDLEFGLSRMYQSMADIADHPVSIRVFRSEEEALLWLHEKP